MMRDRTAAALIAEGLGTFLFFFVGAGSIVLQEHLYPGADLALGGLLNVALAHGLVLAVLVSALGAVSGGHFNPAVTLGVWIMGKITPVRAALYVVAQLVGGLAAGLALKLVFPTPGRPRTSGPRRSAGASPRRWGSASRPSSPRCWCWP